MRISPEDLAGITAQLGSVQGPELIRTMARWGMSGKEISRNSDVFPQALSAGWVTSDEKLTPLGQTLADACRELQFWRDRKGKLVWETLGETLSEVAFEGRHVVEIGSGMGVNLVTLQQRGAHVLGVEPVEAYQQIGAVLWAAEGEPPVEIQIAAGEDTGLATASADVVLCISSVQYCDIRLLFAEISRILKPGGQLIIYNGVMSEYIRHIAKGRKFGVTQGITLANSISYSLVGRRVVPSRSALSTTRPIYPLFVSMRRWLRQAGFSSVVPKTVRNDCMIVAVKSGDPVTERS